MLSISNEPSMLSVVGPDAAHSANGTAQSYFYIDYRGHHSKVLQYIMPLKAVYSRKFGFISQKGSFEHCGKVQTRKRSIK